MITKVVYLSTLFQLAHEVGKAKKNNETPKEIEKKEKRLREYEKLCLDADEMLMPFTYGDL